MFLSANRSPLRRNMRWSGAQPLAAARAPRGDDPAATRGGHAGAEAVTALAHQLALLKGPLHVFVSACRGSLPNLRRIPMSDAEVGPRPENGDGGGMLGTRSPAAYMGEPLSKSMQPWHRTGSAPPPVEAADHAAGTSA